METRRPNDNESGFKVTFYTSGASWIPPPPPPVLALHRVGPRCHSDPERYSFINTGCGCQRRRLRALAESPLSAPLHHSRFPDWSYFWPPQYFVLLEQAAFFGASAVKAEFRHGYRLTWNKSPSSPADITHFEM